jgi:lipoprotein-releasing system ATP-binding protein
MGVTDRVAATGGTQAPPHAVSGPERSGGVPITIRGLTHRYTGPDGTDLVVLDGVDLDLARGEHLAVAGRSGAGKTTLLALIGGLERPRQGTLTVGDVDVAALAGDELAAYRSTTVGFVFQHFGLLDSLTAVENVELAMSVAGVGRRTRRARARALLERVGLDPRAEHLPGELSGGERQRVAIARALANEPQLVLADEPTGNLDDESAEVVLDLLDELARDRGCTFVIATHDRAVTSRTDRSVRLDAGRIVSR